MPLGAYAGKDGVFFIQLLWSRSGFSPRVEVRGAAGGQWSACGVQRWGEKGRIIAANKAYLPDFVKNLIVDKRAVVIAKTAILSVSLRTA